VGFGHERVGAVSHGAAVESLLATAPLVVVVSIDAQACAATQAALSPRAEDVAQAGGYAVGVQDACRGERMSDAYHGAVAKMVNVQPAPTIVPNEGTVIMAHVSRWVRVTLKRRNGEWLMSVASRIRDRKGV